MFEHLNLKHGPVAAAATCWWSNMPIASPTTNVIAIPIPNISFGCAVTVFMILSLNDIHQLKKQNKHALLGE